MSVGLTTPEGISPIKIFRCLYRRCLPLPIPNRAVKPARADGIAVTGGRVGRCLFFTRKPLLETVKGFFRLTTSVAVDGAGPSVMFRNRHCPQWRSTFYVLSFVFPVVATWIFYNCIRLKDVNSLFVPEYSFMIAITVSNIFHRQELALLWGISA